MVELRIVAGALSGQKLPISQFPCRIGRSSTADVRLLDSGVWDQHMELRLDPQVGFRFSTLGEACVLLNGAPSPEAQLRNGDEIQLGAAKIQFWLGEIRQRSQAWREILTWFGFGLLVLIQVLLIYGLIVS
jgi:pSer/pThr/pTyr-binding forkhead associated (FHA) protein